MRLLDTDEMRKLRKEIEPYYIENTQELASDAPDDIRMKEKKYSELWAKQYEEAMISEYVDMFGKYPDEATLKFIRGKK